MNALLIVSLVLAAPGVKDPPKKAEPPGLIGEWVVQDVIRGGKAAPAELPEELVIAFKADGKYEVRVKGVGGKEGTYTTAAGKDVSEIDMNPGTPETAPGLFKFEKDKLILCIDDGGKGATRPAGFESPAGSRVMLMTLKRVEKKKE
jgi:uncharacterized protein (TIGR03067 family)